MAWNTEGPPEAEFDRIWNESVLREPDGLGIASLREQANDGSPYLPSWRYFYYPMEDERTIKEVPPGTPEKLLRDGAAGEKVFSAYKSRGNCPAWIANELSHMSRANVLFGEKVLLARELKELANDPSRATPELAMRLAALAGHLDLLAAEYRQLWCALHKESDLKCIEGKFRVLAAQLRKAAAGIHGRSA
jgi:hypothetical protein